MKNRMWVICLMGMVMAGNGYSRTDVGLILSGIDTLIGGTGFDFILQRPCTSSADVGCNAHFKFLWDGSYAYIAQINGQGRMLDVGKMNLDSIKSAPPDSLMKDDLGLGQPYEFFRIAPDSLQKCVGNCYILKTGIDPRRGNNLYAKIKILAFDVTDSTNHYVKMRFLWTYNDNGFTDLRTSGLDTFHLDTIPTSVRPPERLTNNTFRSSTNHYVFTTASSKFTLPQDLITPNTFVTVYDLAGKTLCRLAPANAGTIDLRRMGAAGRVLLLKVEK